MSGQEIILNLWYVIDDDGLIYSLRARCYVHSGTDDEKLAFLRSLAETDYLIAQPFPIPEWAHTTIHEGETSRKLPVALYEGLRASGHFGRLFEEAYQTMQSQLPVQTKLGIGQDPLVCITPLRGDEDGNMRPLTANTEMIH
jgi:hypothetical protein